MIDLLCIELLYVSYMLCCMASEPAVLLPFFVIFAICVTRLVCVAVEFIRNGPILYIESSRRLVKIAKVLLLILPPSHCIIFAIFSLKLYVILALLVWIGIELLCFYLIKSTPLKRFVMILFGCGYGLILAEWYMRNPMENIFGDNNIAEPICILASALVALIPFAVISMEIQYDDN